MKTRRLERLARAGDPDAAARLASSAHRMASPEPAQRVTSRQFAKAQRDRKIREAALRVAEYARGEVDFEARGETGGFWTWRGERTYVQTVDSYLRQLLDDVFMRGVPTTRGVLAERAKTLIRRHARKRAWIQRQRERFAPRHARGVYLRGNRTHLVTGDRTACGQLQTAGRETYRSEFRLPWQDAIPCGKCLNAVSSRRRRALKGCPESLEWVLEHGQDDDGFAERCLHTQSLARVRS